MFALVAAIKDKLSPRVVNKAPRILISSVERFSLNNKDRELDSPIRLAPEIELLQLEFIETTSYLLYVAICILVN